MSFCYYATIATNAAEATGSFQAQYAKVRQASLVLCWLDGKKMVGNNDNSVLASSDSQLETQYEIAVSALSLTAVHKTV